MYVCILENPFCLYADKIYYMDRNFRRETCVGITF